MSGDFVDIPSEAVDIFHRPSLRCGLLRSGVASVKINSVPTPSVLMTLIFWLCARMISRTMDKPSPMPFLSLPREDVYKRQIRNSEDQKQRILGTKNIRKCENQKQAEGSIRYG